MEPPPGRDRRGHRGVRQPTYQENPSQIEIPEGSRLLIVTADWPALRQPMPPANKFLDLNGLRPHLLGQIAIHGSAAGTSQSPDSASSTAS